MAKKKEIIAPKSKRGGKYNEKLKVNGSFMDIIKASVTHANNSEIKDKEKSQ